MEHRRPAAGAGLFLGAAFFLVNALFLPLPTALGIGLFFGAACTMAMSIYIRLRTRKYTPIRRDLENNLLLFDMANRYTENRDGYLVENGFLGLTAEELIFVTFEDNEQRREVFPLRTVKKAECGVIAGRVTGLCIETERARIQFVTSEVQRFLALMQERILPHKP